MNNLLARLYPMPSRQTEFLSGVRAELPILVGVVPFGVIYGVLARDAGLTVLQAQGMSAIVFAGSAQFIMAQLFSNATPLMVIFLTGALVNLRHVLYSASVAPYLRHLRPAHRGALAYLLTDEAYAVAITRFRREDAARFQHWYLAGAGITLWVTWQTSTAAGVLLGAQVPAGWSLDFTLALSFIALVVPALDNRASVVAAISAGVLSLAAIDLPFRLGLVVASLLGIAAGWSVETWQTTRPAGSDPFQDASN